MIHDKISNIKLFLPDIIQNLFPDFNKYSSIKNFERNEGFFIKEVNYLTKDVSDCVIESHKKYVDVQFLLDGEEIINVFNTDNLKPAGGYNFKDDVIFYKPAQKQNVKIKLRPGYFCVFFPWDAHQAAIKLIEPVSVKKIVIKTDISLFMR